MTPEQKHSVIQAILTFISSILCAITASSCINSLTPDPSPKERGVITLKAQTHPQTASPQTASPQTASPQTASPLTPLSKERGIITLKGELY